MIVELNLRFDNNIINIYIIKFTLNSKPVWNGRQWETPKKSEYKNIKGYQQISMWQKFSLSAWHSSVKHRHQMWR